MTQRITLLSVSVFLVALGAWTVAAQQRQEQSPGRQPRDRGVQRGEVNIPTKAVAVLMPTEGYKARGVIELQDQDGYVHLRGKVWGLEPGKHGFHIHEYGDLRSTDGSSVGSHFAPEGGKHGGPDDPEHHAGDLGNIEANQQGVAMVDIRTNDFPLHFVIGRAIVVHAQADDLQSQPSGAAGDRAGIGIIGFANPELAPAAQEAQAPQGATRSR